MASVFETLERVDFKAGDILLRQGDPGAFFYILQEGEVEVYSRRGEGAMVSLGTISSGQPLGEFAMLAGGHRTASARAISDGYAIKISEQSYRELLEELPEWATAVLQSLVDRLIRLNALVPAIQPAEEVTLVIR